VICPKCGEQNPRVLESRDAEGASSVRRRRECEKCKHRFTTFERVEAAHFLVIKKDGTREAYDRLKLERGLWIACRKRPVAQNQIDRAIHEIEQQCLSQGEKEVSSEFLGQQVVEQLKELDDIAYIRFASVYKNFKDVETFKEELVDFLHKK